MTKLTTLYIQILDKVNTHTLYNRGTTRGGGDKKGNHFGCKQSYKEAPRTSQVYG